MSITSLPNEILLMILKSNECRDIANFGATCKKFNNLIKNNECLWKEKLKNLIPKCMFHTVSTFSCEDKWFQEIKHFYTIKQKIYSEIKSMSPKYHCPDDESSLHDVENVFDIALSSNMSYYYTISLLQDLIRKGHEMVNKNICCIPYTLTEMYYAKVILRYLIYAFVSVKWVQMEMAEKLTPEVVLCLFLQWVDVVNIHSDQDIHMKISGIVKEVEELLIRKNLAPANSTLKLQEQISKQIINERNVVEAITDVIYHQRNMTERQCPSPECFDIEQILTKNCGNMIAIAVTYYFVAKECGVRCKMIQFRNFFFLEWLDTTNDPLPQIYSIDIHTGELRQKRRYPIGGGRQSVRYCPKMFLPFIIELFERKLGITRCRIYNASRMLSLIEDDSKNNIYYVFRSFLQKDESLGTLPIIDLHFIQDEHRRLLSTLANIIKASPLIYQAMKPVRRERGSDVKYAIGMVCTHKTHRYDCVIIDWDLTCNVVWHGHIVTRGLQLGTNQPFYTILLEDLTKRYIAQENLVHKKNPSRLRNYEDTISRYFTHFNGFAYVPNKEKHEEYPYDLHVSNLYRDRMENQKGIEDSVVHIP